MKQFEIKITGSGTKKEIIIALRNLAFDINHLNDDELEDAELEGSTLMTVVKEQRFVKLVDDFFNKAATDIRGKYFPNVNHRAGTKEYYAANYALECFNNGVLTYSDLLKKLVKNCKGTKGDIHSILSKYIADFGDYVFKP